MVFLLCLKVAIKKRIKNVALSLEVTILTNKHETPEKIEANTDGMSAGCTTSTHKTSIYFQS